MTPTRFTHSFLVAFAAFTSITTAETGEALSGFYRYPHVSGGRVVFTSEGDLWTVPIDGGTAVRLTTDEGEERFAHYSPDGKWIAFTGQEDGQDDVYVIPASGGEPRRLTYHPDADQTLGWDNEGNIIFRSTREIPYRGYRIYSIPPEGGYPTDLGLDKGALISFEPGGSRIAYNRYSREFRNWKRYKGGWAQDIWVADVQNLDFTNITDNPPLNDWDGTDAFPMWNPDGRIYFLTDREGRANIFSMNPDGSGVTQHTQHEVFDVRWPSLGGGVIAYQNGMDLWVYDIGSGLSRKVLIQLPTDRVQAREKFTPPEKYITDFELSPDGKRILFCSRGELFTAPAKGKGLIRQLTYSSSEREKFPSWSPDGETIAFWSDRTGEERLYSMPATGGEFRSLGSDDRGWHYGPKWSPDGTAIAFSNETLELRAMDVKTGKSSIVAVGNWEITDYEWSPDGRFLAFVRPDENWNNSVQIWDSKSGIVRAVTDDFMNSGSPAFDPDGKYLFILSDRTANPHLDAHEYTYILDRSTRPYVVLLQKDQPSPFAPKADPKEWDEAEKEERNGKRRPKEADDKKKPVEVKIDFDGLADRVVPVPVPAGNYFALHAVEGMIFYASYKNDGMLGVGLFDDPREGFDLHRFDIEKEKHKVVAEEINGFDLSADGKKLLIKRKDEFTVQGIDEEESGRGRKDEDGEKDDRKVDLSGWDLRVDVRAEWRQMAREAWRLQRDFFWEPTLHKVDWNAVWDQYAPLVPRISTRDELSDLIGEMFAELNCSHTYVWGGDQRHPKHRQTGLLGVDVARDRSGFYRIDRVIQGRPWEPDLTSPLAAPGIDAQAGEYIVRINGRPTSSVGSYLELLIEKAGDIVSVTLNERPSLDGGREVIVKPLASERRLRYYDWVDNRRAYVTEKSGGKIGYIHLVNMGGTGLSQFTGDYYPQHNKPALIMDVRYNGGGFVAPMILSHLSRKVFAFGRPRHGGLYRAPDTGFYGYMAAVCNGETGSDGETFTEGFKRLGLGPVIGTRTWGGWVGIRADKPLIDRGLITQPEFTGWGLDSQWLIEGRGTDPDIVVKEDPAALLRGQDPQLDATIDYLLKQMAEHPMPIPAAPPYPDRSLRR